MADTSQSVSSRLRKTKSNEDAAGNSSIDDGETVEPEFTQLKERTTSTNTTDATHSPPGGGGAGKSLVFLVLIFIGSLLALAVVYASFPKLEEHEVQHIKLPRNIEDAKNLGKLLHRYKDKYFYEVLFGYFVVYIFLQTFAIPGSIFLTVISGFLYSFLIALPLVCTCAAIGASFCYLLSFMAGRPLVEKYFPERAAQWKLTVDGQREHLMNYIIFLRITPFLPNWFINITSPVIEVPLSTFFISTWLGVAPPSFLYIQAGTMLNELTSTSQALSWTNIGLLALFALISVLPVVFKHRLRAKVE